MWNNIVLFALYAYKQSNNFQSTKAKMFNIDYNIFNNIYYSFLSNNIYYNFICRIIIILKRPYCIFCVIELVPLLINSVQSFQVEINANSLKNMYNTKWKCMNEFLNKSLNFSKLNQFYFATHKPRKQIISKILSKMGKSGTSFN